MSFQSGKNGGVTGLVDISGEDFNVKVLAWRFDAVEELIETTGYDPATGECDPNPTYESLMLYGNGSFTGLFQTADAPGIPNLDGATAHGTLTLQSDIGRTHVIGAVMYGMSVSHRGKGAPAAVSGRFRSTTIAENWP